MFARFIRPILQIHSISPEKSFWRSMATALALPSNGVHQVAAEGFSLQVSEYERSRPGYPPAIVADLLAQLNLDGTERKVVLDLASGTGKFTRRLLEHAQLDVLAVEPNADMREGFARNLPGVHVLAGTAADIPVPKGHLGFDAVFVAQGFHWFANEASLRGIYRVLKPGGALCLLWNREDTSVPWISEFLGLVEPLSKGAPQYFKGTWKEAFHGSWARSAFGITDVDQHSKFYRHSAEVTREQLWGRMLSKSYIARLPAEQQDALRADINRVLQRHAVPFVSPRQGMSQPVTEVPLVLEVFVAHKQLEQPGS